MHTVSPEEEAVRVQLERLSLSKTFETSETQRRLLHYLADKALSGNADRLKEYTVGLEAFGKRSDYDPQEDSIVRNQAGRLRTKLREYYTTEGNDDPIVIELPKGGFKLNFRANLVSDEQLSPKKTSAEPTPSEPNPPVAPLRLPWITSLILTVICVGLGLWVLGLRVSNRHLIQAQQVPWPLSRMVNGNRATVVVGEDANLPRLRMIAGRSFSLDEYLSEDFPAAFLPHGATLREAKLLNLLSKGAPFGNATVQNVRSIVEACGSSAPNIEVRTPREVEARDLQGGNYILIGSPVSNPWASVFQHYLNFREVDLMVDQGEKYFLNQTPQPGEQARYSEKPDAAASGGVVYATISLVPNERHNGNVLLLQGLYGEGTEAAGLLLAEESARRKLHDVLLKVGANPDQVWFEALISARSVGAIPRDIEVVAVRLIPN